MTRAWRRRRRPATGRDPLTGLRDRDSLLRRGQALLDAAAAEQQPAAVALVDVDRLKQVNDALGHGAGDRLLVETAIRLRQAVGPGAVLARVGGDEFALVVRLEATAAPGALAGSLLEALSGPVLVDGVEVPTGASVGVAVAGVGGTRVDALLAAADQAMYARKGGGPRPGVVTLSGQAPPADDDLAADLARALAEPARGELRLHHQPQVRPDGTITGFEALLRWEHPRLGPLAPAGFLPLAARHGLATALDDLAVRQALEDHAVLVACAPEAGVSVNLSAHSLLDPGLPGRLAGHLAEAGVDGARLTLEVSESATGLSAGEPTAYVALSASGCGLSVQDFGTHRASLTSLWASPAVREVKLHPRLGAEVARDPEVARRVRALVSAAHGLGLRVVADGVETREAADALATMGCDALQGFAVAPPTALIDLVEWIGFWDRSHRPAGVPAGDQPAGRSARPGAGAGDGAVPAGSRS